MKRITVISILAASVLFLLGLVLGQFLNPSPAQASEGEFVGISCGSTTTGIIYRCYGIRTDGTTKMVIGSNTSIPR
ncbi:MAG: hypothetical protein IH944_03610 [Armatimonadetes bacterium]|nr:hypothetical protein [Armatimonadota bacterium]